MCGSIVGSSDQELKLGHKDKQLENLNSICGLNLDLETFKVTDFCLLWLAIVVIVGSILRDSIEGCSTLNY